MRGAVRLSWLPEIGIGPGEQVLVVTLNDRADAINNVTVVNVERSGLLVAGVDPYSGG